MTQDKPRVLVTGANGFVGTRLCRQLQKDGNHVIAGVRKSSNLSGLVDLKLEYRYGDITSAETLTEMVRDVDYVVHNAGLTKSNTRERFFRVNEQGTRNLFEAAINQDYHVQKIVHISSIAAAGPSTKGKPINETDPPHPVTTYGESKLAGEKVALSYADRTNMVAIRPPGVYGPGDKEIFTMFQAVYRRVKPLIGDLDRRLQLVHVDDLCRGISLALSGSTVSGQIYFIAEKKSYAYKEMIRIMQQASGRAAIPLYLPSPLFRTVAAVSEFCSKAIGATPMLTREKTRELNASWEMNVNRAREELGFESNIEFEDGVKQTFKWYIDQGWL